MSYQVELNVDGRVNGGKFLQTSYTPKSLHGQFSSPKRRVSILASAVQPAACYLFAGVADGLYGGTVRPNSIGHYHMRLAESFH